MKLFQSLSVHLLFFHIQLSKLFVMSATVSDVQNQFAQNQYISDGESCGNSLMSTLMNLVNNKTAGFFLECDSANHNSLFNTNCLEHNYNWTGLQIHRNQEHPPRFLNDFKTVRTFRACSPPTENQQSISVTRHHENDMTMDSEEAHDSTSFNCVQLKEILNSSGRTFVDYLDLTCQDINPYDIITNMPLNIFRVKVICVLYDSSWHQRLTDYLKTYGFDLYDFLTRVEDQISFVIYAYTQSE